MTTTRRRARRSIAAALAFCFYSPVATAHADDATTQADRSAYDWAVKCFVANGSARGTSNDAGDTAKAAAFERRARSSFDTASALADKLGYTGSRFNQDLGLAQAQELPKFVKDVAYLRSTEATCKSLGM
jgi:hypothetical protein